jgi:hypothetical protein
MIHFLGQKNSETAAFKIFVLTALSKSYIFKSEFDSFRRSGYYFGKQLWIEDRE